MRKQGVALEYGINVAVFRRNMSDIVIFEMDPSAVDVFQAGNKAQNGGFTAARGAKQSEKLTIVDGQVKVVDDRFTIKALANSRQMHQRRTRTRLYIQFLTLSHVDATANFRPLRGL